MGVDIDIISTKKSSYNDGSANELYDPQTFNMNHIYIQPDMVWLYSTEYMVTSLKVLTRWGKHYPHYRLLHYPSLQSPEVSQTLQYLTPNSTQYLLVDLANFAELVVTHTILYR